MDVAAVDTKTEMVPDLMHRHSASTGLAPHAAEPNGRRRRSVRPLPLFRVGITVAVHQYGFATLSTSLDNPEDNLVIFPKVRELLRDSMPPYFWLLTGLN